ncbi:hypothetical protein HYW17_05425 [Candidatus Uhrbacteria bacterium]|nr:hypothetical protein [Candidatus Uhrbacteria bacterium]
MSAEQPAEVAEKVGESAPPERSGAPAAISPLKIRVRELSREAEELAGVLEEARRRGTAFLGRLKDLFGG